MIALQGKQSRIAVPDAGRSSAISIVGSLPRRVRNVVSGDCDRWSARRQRKLEIMGTIVKRGLALAAHTAVFGGLVSLLERFDDRRRNILRVLTYHRVDEPHAHPYLYPGLISATPENFAQQLSFLAKNYQVLSISEVLEVLCNKDSLPPRTVLLTFDDAYQDFADNAWPILKQFKLPVTLFVPTAFPDQPQRSFWWDRLYQAVVQTSRRDQFETPLGWLPLKHATQRNRAFQMLKEYVKCVPDKEAHSLVGRIATELHAPPSTNYVLGWDQLRQLVAEGVTLGAHTQTHPLMHRISLERAREEAVGSLCDLQREIGQVLPVLAYPAGGFNNEIARMLEREGFRLAFTTRRGHNSIQVDDRQSLRRINVGRRTSRAMLRAQLLPWMVSFNRWLR